jgi:hypothetical protein
MSGDKTMKARTQPFKAASDIFNQRSSRGGAAEILQADEIKQNQRDQGLEEALDKALDDDVAEGEEDDELEEEDDVDKVAEEPDLQGVERRI